MEQVVIQDDSDSFIRLFQRFFDDKRVMAVVGVYVIYETFFK